MRPSSWFSPLAAGIVALWGCFSALVLLTSLNPTLLEEGMDNSVVILPVSYVMKDEADVKMCIGMIYVVLKACVGFTVFLSACFPARLGLFSLQALLINALIIFPVNTLLRILYRVLTPLRWVWSRLITYLLAPAISANHVQPSFWDSTMDKFVIATEIAFSAGGVINIFDDSDAKLRGLLRPMIDKYFPTLGGVLPDAVLVSSYFRILMGYITIPICWWLVGEYLCNYITGDELAAANARATQPNKAFVNLGDKPRIKTNVEAPEGAEEAKAEDALAISFTIPKCKYLFAARATYASTSTGNKCCLHECRIGVEEIGSRLTGHVYTVTPNLDTGSCLVCITTKPFDPSLDW